MAVEGIGPPVYVSSVAGSFTIAIPTHDRRETVLLAIQSALAQSEPPGQVLVLCDGCTDGTAEAVRGLGDERVEALELEKLAGYAYEHRNRSLELARGEMIMWLGDDDLLLPDHLERLAETFARTGAEVLQAPAIAVWPDDSLSWAGGLDWGIPVMAERLARANTTVMSAVCVRVETARAAGGWNGALEREADWDLWKRLIAGGAPAAMSYEPTVLHFRATGRRQAWSDRVRQNERWFAQISDAKALAVLRPRLLALRDERDAQWLAELAAANSRVVELDRHLDEAGGELERLGGRLARAEAEVARLSDVERTLQQVYAGRWWRLRLRLLALRRRASRLLSRGP